MTDAEVIEGLAKLGLDESNHRLVALLPLLEVAWVDGEVQKAEREWIVDAALAQGFQEGPALEVLERWLTERPDALSFELAARLVAELARRPRPDGSHLDLPQHTPDMVLDLCEHVAAAAGGLFGLVLTVSVEEREAIRRITKVLRPS